MVSVLRPGQRILNIPGYGVQTSRRAVSAGNGLLNNLVAYWPLNEAAGANDALDLHANGLTLTQAASPGADTGLCYSTARTFDGANDGSGNTYFYRNSETLLQTGDVDFTLAAWCYLSNTLIERAVFGKYGGSSSEYLLEWKTIGGAGFNFIVIGGSVGQVMASFSTTNTWALVMAWHDSANNQIGVQVDDGSPVVTAHAAGCNSSDGLFRIGRIHVSVIDWAGRLGPIMLWKSAAGGGGVLSSAQRLALYNAGAGLAYSAFT